MAGTPDKQWLRGSAIVICGGLHGSPSMKPHVYWRATAGREEAEDRADTEDKKAGKKGCRVAPRFAPPPSWYKEGGAWGSQACQASADTQTGMGPRGQASLSHPLHMQAARQGHRASFS